MRISSWLFRAIVSRFDVLAAKVDALSTRVDASSSEIAEVKTMAQQLLQEQAKIMSAMDDLTAQVARTTTLEGSAVTLIQGIAQQLRDAAGSGDTAALQTLTTQLSTQADALAAAITANTPAAPAPTA